MAIPQFRSEGVDQTGGSTSMTVSFSGFTWAVNDIIEIVVATDGWIPVITTANGFALAADPAGNTASQTTNGGVAGAADCGIFVYWKRATGNNPTADPPPVFQAPSAQSGTSWCLQPNSFSGARTSGTPYHAITKSIVSTASASVTSTAATSTLANCLFMPRVASANDDQAFNNWTFTGSAGPSGSGAPNTGWHSSSGNACAFTGAEGGFAAAGGPHSATTTFGASTKQALVTLVMASIAEPAAITGTEAATLDASSPASSGGVLATGSAAAADAGSAAATSGGVTVTGAEASALGGSVAASSGSTITSTGTEAATLGASLASSSGTIAGGPTGSVAASLAASRGAASGAVGITGSASATLAASAAGSAGGVSLTGTAAAADTASSASATGTVFTPSTLGVGVAAWREKANTTAPNTGTLTTLTTYPAWTPSTAYQVLLNARVINGGNTYEIAQAGTSAASGGPTGTGLGIVDGSCRWNFLASGSPAVNTQPTSSFFVVSLGTGADHTSGTAPRDNNGNTYSQIGSKSFFAAFPNSSAATYAAANPATGSTGHTFSADWGVGDDGGGDEKSIAAVEIIGGTHVQDHSAVEASPVSNVCTSSPVTTTGPAVLVCFCWLNGGTHADGFVHVATPGSGFALLPLASGLMEIGNTAGQVQGCTIAKQVSTPGTYTATLTTAAGEGAVMHLIAVQGVAGINGTEAATSSGSAASSTGTVTTPRTGTGTGTLGSSAATTAGSVSLTGTAAAADDGSRGVAAGVVAVTGTSGVTGGASIGASSGTLIPVIAGNVAATSGASAAASFGSVISGHAGDVGATLASSLLAAAGTVLVTATASLRVGGSSAASAGLIIVTGGAALTAGDSQASSRAVTPGSIVPRLSGQLATNGQLAATLQLQGVTVADITGPITIYQGDTAGFLLTVTDDAGLPFDLTAATAIDVRVKTADGAPDPPVIALSLAAGVVPLDQSASKGKATIAFSTADTAIAAARYRINVVVTAPGLRQHVVLPRDFIIAAVV